MYTGSVWRAAKLGFKMIPLIVKYRLKRNVPKELFIFLGALAATLALLLVSKNHFPNDDQFILYRYIDNIALGKGFVFNQGERILGATTPLFTLLCTFFKFIFRSVDTKLLVGTINSLLFSLSALFFYRLSKLFVSEKFSLVAVSLFILNLSRVSLEGMESPLFILTLCAFLYYLLKEKHYTASVWLALCVLTRPDAGLIALFAFVYWLMQVGVKKTVKLSTLAIVVALPWLVFATCYFGSFIPASLIAKTHVNTIIHQSAYQAFKVQLASLSRIYWGKVFDPKHISLQVMFNLLPFLFLVGSALRKLTTKNWIVYAIPFVYLIAFSISNPVMFPWYISQAEPLWLLISFVGFVAVTQYFHRPVVQIGLMVLILLGPAFFFTKELTSKDKGSKWPLYEVAEYINAYKKSGESIGVNNMGIISYYTGNYIFDFFGLVNDYAYAFYEDREACADKEAMYVIPSKLVMYTMPDWLVTSGDDELSTCFKESRWFKAHYKFENKVEGASIWKFRN